MKHDHNHSLGCQDILKNLNAYIDGELDAGVCDQMEAHIDACPDCQIVVNTLKKTIQLYQVDGQDTTLPSETRRRLYACLDLDDYVQPK
ncbi:MAG: zf-HC2 domain-containing protein [Anaerolineaceae bacterium]|nr:zf-HC2 domain-containing protein [Anaerolineaceae bacterium]